MQLTIRLPDELGQDLKRVTRVQNESMNGLIVGILENVVTDFKGSPEWQKVLEVERILGSVETPPRFAEGAEFQFPKPESQAPEIPESQPVESPKIRDKEPLPNLPGMKRASDLLDGW